MYFVYVLFSLKDRKYYIGYSTDITKRFLKHTSGEVNSTRSRRPLKLLYFEGYINRKDAKGRERFLKGGSGHNYLKKQLVRTLKENV